MNTSTRVMRLPMLLGGLLLWAAQLPVAFAMPGIQHWVTDNGARVYFVQAPELPMVDVNITFAAGSVRDDGQAGLAHMTSTLLDMGAAGLSANEIASRVESLGAELTTGSARDMAWVKLRISCLTVAMSVERMRSFSRWGTVFRITRYAARVPSPGFMFVKRSSAWAAHRSSMAMTSSALLTISLHFRAETVPMET